MESFEIEIEKIEISYDGEFETVFEGPMVYDLYADKSGPLIEMAYVPLREGSANQLRVILGQARAYGANGEMSLTLKSPSASVSGIKAPISPVLNVIPGGVEYGLDVDFELSNNIRPQGSGLLFTPVIRAYNRTYRKRIYGSLLSDNCSPGTDDDLLLSHRTLELIKNGETLKRGETDNEGRFIFVGLKPGEYALWASAENHNELLMEIRLLGADTQVALRLAGKCAAINGIALV